MKVAMRRRRLVAAGFAFGLIVAPAAARAEDSFESMRLERIHRDHDAYQAPHHSRTRETGVRREGRPTQLATVPQGEIWAVAAGSDLRKTLGDWCARKGWSLVWKSDFTYEMTSSAAFSGTFEDAVRAVVLSMKDVRPSPTIELYGGNKVLVLANQGSGVTD